MPAKQSKRTVCFVCSDDRTPGRAGDRDTVHPSLSSLLASSGYDVTILHVPDRPGLSNASEACRLWCADRGLAFASADLDPIPEIRGGRAVRQSLAVYEWLKERRFEFVHFAERGALGYYTLLARRQGLCLAESRIVVGVHGPTLFQHEKGEPAEPVSEALELDFMERECVALADMVWTSRASWFDWMRERRWTMPRKRVVRPEAPAADAIDCPRPRVRASVQQERDRRAWLDYHRRASRRRPHSARSGVRGASCRHRPLVSVCLTHHDRPRLLDQALSSLRDQTYQPFEIVLVDDGSRTDEARRYLRSLEPEFRTRGWRLVRQRNRYLGAARNRAAREARGRYLLFMDDDNVAKPEELEVFVRAAGASGADVLTCFLDVFRGSQPPGQHTRPVHRLTFLGGALTVGMTRNCLGDANCLISRRAFDAIGGFTEDRQICGEDWELLAKAALSGYRVEVVPEPLVWYRQSASGMLNTTPERANRQRALRPYVHALPRGLESVMALASAGAGNGTSLDAECVVFHAPDSIRRVAIFGAGRGAAQAIALAHRCGWDVASLVDNNEEVWGSKLAGLDVSSPAALVSAGADLAIVTSHSGRESIERQLRSMGLRQPIIFYRDTIVVGGVEVRVSGR
jgi:GT2 family glycosyltransferase